jgi:hypothetical protein
MRQVPSLLARLHVLTGDQGKQPNRLGLLSVQFGASHGRQDRQCVADQRADQPVAGLGVIPGAGRLAHGMVVVMGEQGERGRSRDEATHPADRGDQLRHGVLGGDRVVQQGGVQRPPLPALEDPGLGHHGTDSLEDPLWPLRAAQPGPPQGQHRRMEPRVGQR